MKEKLLFDTVACSWGRLYHTLHSFGLFLSYKIYDKAMNY